MDEATFKERVKKLNEINKVVEKLDPAIRGQAFALLEDYIGAGKVGRHRPEGGQEKDQEEEAPPADSGDVEAVLETFVAAIDSTKPADNAKALAAFYYSEYGKTGFTTDEIQELADKAGLTVPERIDNTLKVAKAKNKAMFRQDGSTFIPTVNGETFFKEKYKVKKGKRPKPSTPTSMLMNELPLIASPLKTIGLANQEAL
jgi:hypothetical protein